MKLSEKSKKILKIVLRVLAWLVVAFAVYMMVFTIFTVSTVDNNERSLFGHRFYIVQSDSMSKSENNKDLDVHFKAGDIIIIRLVENKTELQPGDVIAFISANDESLGETITHMIYDRKVNSDGNLIGYVTYGTNTGSIDEAVVEPSMVIGTYSGKIPGLGNFFAFVKSVPGYIVCILIPFLLLILYNGINIIRLFRRYKKEQSEILQSEKEQIAAERKQNEEMLKELLELKAQLAQQAAAANPTQSEQEQSQDKGSEAQLLQEKQQISDGQDTDNT